MRAILAPSEISEEQQPLWLSVVLHLLPGVAMLLFMALLSPVLQQRGLPMTFTAALSILCVLVPIELGLPLLLGRRGAPASRPILRYRRSSPLWHYLLFVPLLVFWFWNASSLWNGVESQLAARTLTMPDWLVRPLVFDDIRNYDPGVVRLTALFAVLMSGVIAPILEEIYFRGWLLPRIDRLGGWAVLLNTVLFAFHHVWTPLENPGRVLAWLPIVFVVWRTRNIRIGFLVHLITNLFGTAGMLFVFM